MINIQIAIDCEMEGIIMIYGHILAKETERAYAAPIREAIRYCRETDVSNMGECRMELRGEEMIVQICDRVTGRGEEKLPEDVHRPFCQTEASARIKKIVIKMAVDIL